MVVVAVQEAVAAGLEFNDLRGFIEVCQRVDDWRLIEGADWDLEIGALTEATAELLPDPPMLIFDRIKGYPAGFRVVSLPLASHKRAALALGLPMDRPKLELVRMAARHIKEAHNHAIPPVEVQTGPVMENVFEGEDVDLWSLPTPRIHSSDGGRYLGTGDVVINRDPDTGYVNLGTYRMQIHDRNLLGLWISPGQHGRQICQKYWDRGENAPIVACFGVDPVLYHAAHTKIPWGKSELDFVGGLRGSPEEVIRGPLTGLPIPARAEIVIEGEVPPPSVEAREEGPFGEWPGYYSGGTLGTGELQPVVHVKALYHRNDPIIHNQAPSWPGAASFGIPMDAGLVWDQMESAGVQDIVGVYTYSAYLLVVAIRQRFAGHAKQAGLAAVSCGARTRHGRYVVVVDEDIDVTNFQEVIWAMETRVDPVTDIEIIPGGCSTPVEPRIPPERRAVGDFTISRAIFYAVRPWGWRDRFPKVSRSPADLRRQVVEKYRSVLPFPEV